MRARAHTYTHTQTHIMSNLAWKDEKNRTTVTVCRATIIISLLIMINIGRQPLIVYLSRHLDHPKCLFVAHWSCFLFLVSFLFCFFFFLLVLHFFSFFKTVQNLEKFTAVNNLFLKIITFYILLLFVI